MESEIYHFVYSHSLSFMNFQWKKEHSARHFSRTRERKCLISSNSGDIFILEIIIRNIITCLGFFSISNIVTRLWYFMKKANVLNVFKVLNFPYLEKRKVCKIDWMSNLKYCDIGFTLEIIRNIITRLG